MMNLINSPLIWYVLMAAMRDKLILSCLALTAVILSLSLFFGDSAIVEKSQFVVVYAAGGLRLLAVMGAVLFTAFYVQRSFAQRDIEYLLTRPLSRVAFVISHAAALVVIAAVLAGIVGAALSILATPHFSFFLAIWVGSLFCEVMLTALVAFFFAMVLESATVSTLMVLAFYVLARMLGQLLGIIQENAVMWGASFLSPLMKMISMVLPRFDLMTQSSWLIYGPQGNEGVLFLVAQSLVFAFLVLTASIVDLKRRQF